MPLVMQPAQPLTYGPVRPTTVRPGRDYCLSMDSALQAGPGGQGQMEKTSCKIICGAPTTLAVKGLMIMMMDSAHSRFDISFLSFPAPT